MLAYTTTIDQKATATLCDFPGSYVIECTLNGHPNPASIVHKCTETFACDAVVITDDINPFFAVGTQMTAPIFVIKQNLAQSVVVGLGQAKRVCIVVTSSTPGTSNRWGWVGASTAKQNVGYGEFVSRCEARRATLGWAGKRDAYGGWTRILRSLASDVFPSGYAGGLTSADVIDFMVNSTGGADTAGGALTSLSKQPRHGVTVLVTAVQNGAHALRVVINVPPAFAGALRTMQKASLVVVTGQSPAVNTDYALMVWLATQLPVVVAGSEARDTSQPFATTTHSAADIVGLLGRAFRIAVLDIAPSDQATLGAVVDSDDAWADFEAGFARSREEYRGQAPKNVADLLLGTANTPYGRTDLVGFLNARMRSGAPIGFALPCWFWRGEHLALVEAVACFLLGDKSRVDLALAAAAHGQQWQGSGGLASAIKTVVLAASSPKMLHDAVLNMADACPTCLVYTRRGDSAVCCDGCAQGKAHDPSIHTWLRPEANFRSGSPEQNAAGRVLWGTLNDYTQP